MNPPTPPSLTAQEPVLWLLAQAQQRGPNATPGEIAQAMRDYLGGNKYEVPVGGLFMMFGGLVCLFMVLYVVKHWRRRREHSRPINVFKRVARKVGLHPADQHLLMRIARHQNLPSPLTLLLSATTLRHHAHFYAEAQPARQRPQIMGRIAAIRRDLFDNDRKRDAAETAREL